MNFNQGICLILSAISLLMFLYSDNPDLGIVCTVFAVGYLIIDAKEE